MFTALIVATLIVISNAKSIHHDEICGGFDGRRLYLDLGEHGTLFSSHQNSSRESIVTEYGQCTLEIVTCPSCVIVVHFSYLNLSNNCGNNLGTTHCPCSYISVFEPPYEQVSEQRYCGYFLDMNNATLFYKSITRTTTIRFVYKTGYNQAFVLNYFSERNRRFIDGSPILTDTLHDSNEITSPFFPNSYPRDLSVEYIINCKAAKICRIKLSFADFQISRSSLIEFFDWNGQRMFVTTGAIFRPPILVSTGPTIVVRFYANGGTNIGYKFLYSFLLGDYNRTSTINTNCGGLVENLGGGITMRDMVDSGTKSFDCVWILKPPQGFLHQKTHLFLKVSNFEEFEEATMIVREGFTSNGPLVLNITTALKQMSSEHVVTINHGFYVSLQGDFNPRTKLEIVYAAFSYNDCSLGTDFLCQNQRCISPNLECDGFNQCGDNSDEPEICLKNNMGKIYPHAPNFYFPKSERDIDLKTATIIFVISSFALICLIICLIVLIYRINVKGTRTNHFQAHLQSINDLLDETLSRTEEEEIIIPDDPPDYEAPPTYAEVIKVIDSDHNSTITVLRKLSHHRHSKKYSKRHSEADNSSISTVDSAINLIANSTGSQIAVVLTPPEDPVEESREESKQIQDYRPSTSDDITTANNTETDELSTFLKRDNEFSIDSNEEFFSFTLGNRSHCLSDSNLVSVKSIPEENSATNAFKMNRSLSVENMFKL